MFRLPVFSEIYSFQDKLLLVSSNHIYQYTIHKNQILQQFQFQYRKQIQFLSNILQICSNQDFIAILTKKFIYEIDCDLQIINKFYNYKNQTQISYNENNELISIGQNLLLNYSLQSETCIECGRFVMYQKGYIISFQKRQILINRDKIAYQQQPYNCLVTNEFIITQFFDEIEIMQKQNYQNRKSIKFSTSVIGIKCFLNFIIVLLQNGKIHIINPLVLEQQQAQDTNNILNFDIAEQSEDLKLSDCKSFLIYQQNIIILDSTGAHLYHFTDNLFTTSTEQLLIYQDSISYHLTTKAIFLSNQIIISANRRTLASFINSSNAIKLFKTTLNNQSISGNSFYINYNNSSIFSINGFIFKLQDNLINPLVLSYYDEVIHDKQTFVISGITVQSYIIERQNIVENLIISTFEQNGLNIIFYKDKIEVLSSSIYCFIINSYKILYANFIQVDQNVFELSFDIFVDAPSIQLKLIKSDLQIGQLFAVGGTKLIQTSPGNNSLVTIFEQNTISQYFTHDICNIFYLNGLFFVEGPGQLYFYNDNSFVQLFIGKYQIYISQNQLFLNSDDEDLYQFVESKLVNLGIKGQAHIIEEQLYVNIVDTQLVIQKINPIIQGFGGQLQINNLTRLKKISQTLIQVNEGADSLYIDVLSHGILSQLNTIQNNVANSSYLSLNNSLLILYDNDRIIFQQEFSSTLIKLFSNGKLNLVMTRTFELYIIQLNIMNFDMYKLKLPKFLVQCCTFSEKNNQVILIIGLKTGELIKIILSRFMIIQQVVQLAILDEFLVQVVVEGEQIHGVGVFGSIHIFNLK